MTRTTIITMALSLGLNAWLIGFNADHMKHRAILYVTDTLDTLSESLKEPQEVAHKPHDMTMPPVMRVSDLERMTEIDQRKADVIAQILNQTNGK